MNTANSEIRSAAKNAGIFLWEIAERYGINDSNFTRKLRKELPEQEREKILGIIEGLKKEKHNV